MSHTRTVVVLFVLGAALAACSKSPQEQARDKLVGEMGVVWAPGNFLDAAKNGKSDVVGLFLQAGMDSETADDQGRTALILAAAAGHTATVKTLLANGADPKNTDKQGRSALIWAAELDHIPAVQALLTNGADVNHAANDGLTALAAAKNKGDAELVALLEKAGAT
ncbi:MAG TPA: ankyrin repeat domain-containing protein [Candidatus Margulisiibacteriota bacterium]|nr:ankyrin repeat domain-containing protein [Candidatus Margulisiibacteriota bacterium]